MQKLLKLMICIWAFSQIACAPKQETQVQDRPDSFPDGTPISDWFRDTAKIELNDLGKQFVITDFGAVNDSLQVQTQAIQHAIDQAAQQGGGVVVIPQGVYQSGALFFKPKTALHLADGAVLKGSDTIADYPIMPSRMEGRCLDYYPALVNAYGVDNFSISGKGTIDGNGLKYWAAFWQRRKENAKCTNLEVSRPRLVFVRDCNNVQFQDVRMVNAGFWTNHFYKCNNVKLLGLSIESPFSPVKAPSTDAVDIDICTNVLIKDTYMSVNDDAVALKGGKGPWADKDTCNGMNANILIEDCDYGFSHSALTCGSEAMHNRNILMRNCTVTEAKRLFWLKMREDTPQTYEYITVEHIKGYAKQFICAKTWSQFFDLQGREKKPETVCRFITIRDIELECDKFFDVKTTEFTKLTDFTFENLKVTAKNGDVDKSLIENFTLKNVMVNGKLTN